MKRVSAPEPTDDAGRFELTDVKAGSTTLAVAPADWFVTGPSLVLRDVLPTEEELRIEVPDTVLPSASATVRLLIDGEPAASDTRVEVRSRTPFSVRELHPDEQGHLAAKRLRPGEYELSVHAPGRAVQRRVFYVSPEEKLDLGDMNLAVGGRVRLLLDGEDAGDSLQARVLDPSGMTVEYFDVDEGRGESNLLPPGHVCVRLGNNRVATTRIEGTIIDGETVELQAILHPGTWRSVLVRTADRSPLPSFRSVLVYGAAGELVQCRDEYMGGFPGTESFEDRINLAGLELGTYRIVVQLPDGRGGEGNVTVRTLDRSRRTRA